MTAITFVFADWQRAERDFQHAVRVLNIEALLGCAPDPELTARVQETHAIAALKLGIFLEEAELMALTCRHHLVPSPLWPEPSEGGGREMEAVAGLVRIGDE